MDYGDKDILSFYFKQYFLNMIYDTQNAYKLLDENYKAQRFPKYEDFEKYVKNNVGDFQKSILMKYKIEEFDDYKEYLCLDNYNNYYIFKENEPMNYTVLLDQYTINDKIFVDKYKKQSDGNKAEMILEKFCQMLNRQDFSSAYNILNENFKNKYFDTQDKFVEYISNNFYKYNKFDYIEITREDGKYKIKTKINNYAESNDESAVKRFNVEIDKEKYTISFDI